MQSQDEGDILSLDDNYRELMDQLHPLREAEYQDIFPALKFLSSPEKEDARKTMI